jgi:hypothetical protein
LGVVVDRLVVTINHQGAVIGHQGAVDIVALKSKKLSLRKVLIVEVINLDVWIFTPVPRWTLTVVIYDNDLEYEWSRDEENDGNTGDAIIFRQIQVSCRIIVICLVFLYFS